jgi:hypothetical protein
MGIVVDRHQGPPPGEDDIIAMMRADGLAPHAWGNAPGDTYGWHEHGYEKLLYCIRGRIVFHTGAGDADLGPGTSWCCHRTPRTRPPSAPKGSAAWRRRAKVRSRLAEQVKTMPVAS